MGKVDGRFTRKAPWRSLAIEALSSGPKTTMELRSLTGYDGIGRVMGEMLVERVVKRAGYRQTGKRPTVVWALC